MQHPRSPFSCISSAHDLAPSLLVSTFPVSAYPSQPIFILLVPHSRNLLFMLSVPRCPLSLIGSNRGCSFEPRLFRGDLCSRSSAIATSNLPQTLTIPLPPIGTIQMITSLANRPPSKLSLCVPREHRKRLLGETLRAYFGVPDRWFQCPSSSHRNIIPPS